MGHRPKTLSRWLEAALVSTGMPWREAVACPIDVAMEVAWALAARKLWPNPAEFGCPMPSGPMPDIIR